jgi:ribosomal protein S18 acetylase RimI-like enzyme
VPAIADEMDVPLDRLGYRAEGRTTTLFNPLEFDPVADAGTRLEPAPSEAWLAARQRITGEADRDHAAFCSMVRAVVLPKMFASTHVDGTVAAIAYGVIGNGFVVMEAVATDAAFRGRGLARKTLHNLIAWSKAEGADAACLQVQLDNAPALALYASLGFGRELYRYHYRRRPA